MKKIDTLVVGAGLVGSSVTMHLAQLQKDAGWRGDIVCVDLDLEGKYSSSELNAGGVRATFLQPCNIRSSRVSIDYYQKWADEVGYRACGYLWLHSDQTWASAQKTVQSYSSAEWPMGLVPKNQIQSEWNFLNKLEGVAGAVWGPRDGLINPNLLKLHFRSKARGMGAYFEDRIWISGIEYVNEKIIVRGTRLLGKSDESRTESCLVEGLVAGETEEVSWECRRLVNCAGAWAGRLAELMGYESPCRPVRRQVSIFDTTDLDLSPYGMIVDTSGVYLHPEATYGLAGFADPAEPPGFSFAYDGESFFQEKIWPALYERSTYFERLKHITGWAGLYEVSPDESAILGRVEKGSAAQQGQVFEAHSFSGHGAMHSYAAGLALAELMVYDRFLSVDLMELSAGRFKTGKLLHESWVI